VAGYVTCEPARKSSQYQYKSFCFEYPINTVLDTLLLITDPLIYAATSPHTDVF